MNQRKYKLDPDTYEPSMAMLCWMCAMLEQFGEDRWATMAQSTQSAGVRIELGWIATQLFKDCGFIEWRPSGKRLEYFLTREGAEFVRDVLKRYLRRKKAPKKVAARLKLAGFGV